MVDRLKAFLKTQEGRNRLYRVISILIPVAVTLGAVTEVLAHQLLAVAGVLLLGALGETGAVLAERFSDPGHVVVADKPAEVGG